ncbi:15495_t:CDS:2 [Cetraspora pellucida]|uniref:15495_t:CDS:1 n=1 Tax=Cetraspora pellucida TaxID=1433469 RepID=A0ACA9KZ71_9GLOM|nr:15495_t:CDS:2 [Cetraspora pellucida]
MTDIVIDEYWFLLCCKHNSKGDEFIYIGWFLAFMMADAGKILINSSKDLLEKVLAYIEKKFEEVSLVPKLRKSQSISSENDSKVYAKPPCEASEKSISKELSKIVRVPLRPLSTEINMQKKQKKKLLKYEFIQNFNLPKISAKGFC